MNFFSIKTKFKLTEIKFKIKYKYFVILGMVTAMISSHSNCNKKARNDDNANDDSKCINEIDKFMWNSPVAKTSVWNGHSFLLKKIFATIQIGCEQSLNKLQIQQQNLLIIMRIENVIYLKSVESKDVQWLTFSSKTQHLLILIKIIVIFCLFPTKIFNESKFRHFIPLEKLFFQAS